MLLKTSNSMYKHFKSLFSFRFTEGKNNLKGNETFYNIFEKWLSLKTVPSTKSFQLFDIMEFIRQTACEKIN